MIAGRPGREREQARRRAATTSASSARPQVERAVGHGRARRLGAAPPRSAAACTSPRARSRPRRPRPSPSPAGRRRRGSGTRRRRPPSRGTASAITPVVISSVASAGRPRAIPPSRVNWPVPVRALDDPGEQEQRRRDQPVVDHLQHGAVEAEVVRREQAERDQPELRERRVGDHAAEVGRAEREQRAVDEPDRREHEDRPSGSRRSARGTSGSR